MKKLILLVVFAAALACKKEDNTRYYWECTNIAGNDCEGVKKWTKAEMADYLTAHPDCRCEIKE